jgi:hypothetical protein
VCTAVLPSPIPAVAPTLAHPCTFILTLTPPDHPRHHPTSHPQSPHLTHISPTRTRTHPPTDRCPGRLPRRRAASRRRAQARVTGTTSRNPAPVTRTACRGRASRRPTTTSSGVARRTMRAGMACDAPFITCALREGRARSRLSPQASVSGYGFSLYRAPCSHWSQLKGKCREVLRRVPHRVGWPSPTAKAYGTVPWAPCVLYL